MKFLSGISFQTVVLNFAIFMGLMGVWHEVGTDRVTAAARSEAVVDLTRGTPHFSSRTSWAKDLAPGTVSHE